MTTAADIALRAYQEKIRQEDAERRERQRQDEERKQREHRQDRNEALGRLKRSLIPEWFPDVEWTFSETWRLPGFGDSTVVRDIWTNGGGDSLIRLMVEDHPDKTPLPVALVTRHDPHSDGHGRWASVSVDGPVAIGRYLEQFAQEERADRRMGNTD